MMADGISAEYVYEPLSASPKPMSASIGGQIYQTPHNTSSSFDSVGYDKVRSKRVFAFLQIYVV